jgi:hypothetical protein
MKAKQIEINGATFEISFPNVGQTLQIEAYRQTISRGQYGNMVLSPTESSSQSLDLIDTIAHFEVLMPKKFKESLKVESITELSLSDAKPLVAAYKTQFLPWFVELLNELKQV